MTDITRFVTESALCPHCEQRVQSRHPEQLSQAAGAAAVCFGPRLLATAADLHSRLGVPYAKIADFLGMMLGEHITAGALCQNVLRLAKLAKPIYNELVDELRRAAVVHADETGWRIGTLNAWLWVFTNQQTTVYVIRSGEGARGHGAIIEILGEQFPAVLVNQAERMLRPAVVSRKTQGCNKSQTGADAHAILGSILASEKQNRRSPVRRLVTLIRRRASPGL